MTNNTPSEFKGPKLFHPDYRWATGITVGYLTFITATLSLVFFSFSVPVNLEKEDYYEATLQYQDQIDRQKRALALDDPLQIELNGSGILHIRFPVDHTLLGVNGTIHLFRPSDHRLDRVVAIEANEQGQQSIAVDDLLRGHWIVKVAWDSGGTEYYQQRSLAL